MVHQTARHNFTAPVRDAITAIIAQLRPTDRPGTQCLSRIEMRKLCAFGCLTTASSPQ